jgi:hypothetical protein
VPSGKHVHMEVADALADGPAAVDDHAEAASVPGVGRDLPDHLEEPAADALVHELAEGRDVLAGDDERVERRLGRAVLEGDDVGVFVEELGADLAAGDLAEHAVRHAARIAMRW